jgi:hypothetical protein
LWKLILKIGIMGTCINFDNSELCLVGTYTIRIVALFIWNYGILPIESVLGTLLFRALYNNYF